MPKYTLPATFSTARAEELAALVNAAYNQLDQGPGWNPPQGYNVVAPLSAKEPWKGLGPLANFLGPIVSPVPFGFVATKGTDIYVVIRGTKTPLEWFDDFTSLPVAFTPNGQNWGRITKGFSLLYRDLGPQIEAALQQINAGGGSLGSIFITGHSLGAALAHIAAAGITAKFAVKPVSYTFSGPRAGDHGFAAATDTATLVTWRIFNTEDIVPTVPPAAVQMATPNMGMHGLTPVTHALTAMVSLGIAGYQHIGYPVGVTFHEEVVADNHDMNRLLQELVS